MIGWLNIALALAALLCLLGIVWMCWDIRVRARKGVRLGRVGYARARAADGAWSDRELRRAEYQLALRLAVGEGDAETGRVRLEAVSA